MEQLSNQMGKYCTEVDDIIAKELKMCGADERRALQKARLYQRFVHLARKTKIFNWKGLENILFKDLINERQSHRLVYNHAKKMFEQL